MNNRMIKYSVIMITAVLMLVLPGVGRAVESDPEDTLTARIIGEVVLDKSVITPQGLKQVDRLVAVLKKMPSDKIIRLDCRYKGDARREADVRAAYTAAARIEKYLRENHKLKLDMWISARMNQGKKGSPKLVFSILSDEINQYQKLPVNPEKERP